MELLVSGGSQEVNEERINYAQLIDEGLNRSEALGFNLEEALAANYGDTYQGDRPAYEEVLGAAAQLAAIARLDAQFFDRPARTVLLLAAADSWVGTELREDQTGAPGDTIDNERRSLADLILIAGGAQSGVARDLRKHDQAAADRYILADKCPSQIRIEEARYLKTLENSELANQVQALIMEKGEGSLLASQRERLNIPAIPEQAIRVRVLMLAPSYTDLVACGYIEAGQTFFDMSTPEAQKAAAKRAEQEAKAAPLLEAHRIYHQRFAEQLGALAPAWATKERDGSSVITLTAPYAYGLLNQTSKGSISERFAGLTWHEATHTQRPLFVGAHLQLALAFEERRAVWNSDGAGDYVDARLAMDDIGRITDIDLVEELAQASRTEDPLSTFLCAVAGKMGLRTMMLMTAAKPDSYTRSPIRAAHFIDLSFMTRDNDGSEFDAIIRDTMERRGSERLRANARAWLAQLAKQGHDRYLTTVEVTSLTGVGLQCTQPYYEEALTEKYGPRDPNVQHALLFA